MAESENRCSDLQAIAQSKPALSRANDTKLTNQELFWKIAQELRQKLVICGQCRQLSALHHRRIVEDGFEDGA
jgi:hypothetical protein